MSFSNHCHCCSHRAVGMTFPSSFQHEVLWVPYSFWPQHVSAFPALVNPHIFLFRLREDASRPTRNKMEIYNEDIATVSTWEEKKQNLEGAIVTVFITVKSLCAMRYKLQSSWLLGWRFNKWYNAGVCVHVAWKQRLEEECERTQLSALLLHNIRAQ